MKLSIMTITLIALSTLLLATPLEKRKFEQIQKEDSLKKTNQSTFHNISSDLPKKIISNTIKTYKKIRNIKHFTNGSRVLEKDMKFKIVQSNGSKSLRKGDALRICGIDSAEDDYYGCVDESTTRPTPKFSIQYLAGPIVSTPSTLSTKILWVSTKSPQKQELPAYVNLCKGKANCWVPD